MNEQFREKIKTDHPHLYHRGLYLECNDGWLQLIFELSRQLEPIIKLQHESVFNDEDSLIYCTQCKEKFGTLRFYMNTYIPSIENIIEKYEDLSGTICERCGGEATTRKIKGWVTTICDTCYSSQSH